MISSIIILVIVVVALSVTSDHFVHMVHGGVLSDSYDAYREGKKYYNYYKNIRTGYDIYEACIAAGSSNCGTKATLCALYKQFGSKFAKGIWISG